MTFPVLPQDDDVIGDDEVPDGQPIEDAFDPQYKPADVLELADAAQTELLFPLIRGLASSPLDFRIRIAAIQQLLAKEAALQTRDNAAVSRDDLDAMLQWLKPEWRHRTISGLQRWGWWHYENNSWRTSQAGLSLYRCLLPALEATDDNAIMEAFVMANASQELGHDPARALHALQRQLHLLLEEIERANDLHSSVLMRELKSKIPRSLELGEVLLKFKTDLLTEPGVSEEVRKTHRVLARVTRAASHMERTLTELESQQFTLPENCTLDDVIRALMATDKEDLAAAVRPAIHQPYVPTLYLNTSRIAYAADDYLSRTKEAPLVPEWNKPEEVSTMTSLPTEWLEGARRLVADLQALPADVEELSLEEVVVRETPHESLLRLALLGLMGAKEVSQGVAGELAGLPFRVHTEEQMTTLYGKSVSRISVGRVQRVKA